MHTKSPSQKDTRAVWRLLTCNKVVIREHVFEALLDKLMSTSNQVESVDMVELACYFGAKKPSCSSWAHTPSINIIRV